MKDIINEINKKFILFQSVGNYYKSIKGQGTSHLEEKYTSIVTKTIPELLYKIFPESQYKIKGSVGVGRITSCPWIAIMNQTETRTPLLGVYIVFLFSLDLSKIYLTLNQGTTRMQHDDYVNKRNEIRKTIEIKTSLIHKNNNLQIDNVKYNEASIFDCEWNIDDSNYDETVLNEISRLYNASLGFTNKVIREQNENSTENTLKSFSLKKIIEYIDSTGLIYSNKIVKRFTFSLMSKHLLILSGLAGSGKTQLALAFANALVKSKEKQMCVVSVGADWTNREPLLGFPNALKQDSYILPESGVLQLLIEANKEENHDKPYFLILDEMNMSYVERYFADFLSAMESHEKIALWDGSEEKGGVPKSIGLPDNLFIIGTINVDETTYMFSPKVLDRANVIEFKISRKEMNDFLDNIKEVHPENIIGKGADMAEDFVKISRSKELKASDQSKETFKSFFNELKTVNAEFGYRSATEIFRFISQASQNDDTQKNMTEEEIIDAAIVQKLLPKLHGSRKKLSPVLEKLWNLCFKETDSISISRDKVSFAIYKETADKICRMYEDAQNNGFTSFAEA